MIYLLAAALLLTPTFEECPVFLERSATQLRDSEFVQAQSYGRCMSIPHVPDVDELRSRKVECARALPTARRAALKKAIAWVDHVSANCSGCETRIGFRQD